jgi:UDP-N-acetylmuramoylalanine--D-glutamate ligase
MTTHSHIVIGLGDTGLSVVAYLKDQGIHPFVMDTRLTPTGLNQLLLCYPDTPYHCGELDEELLSKAQQIIISPGVDLNHPAVVAAKKNGVEIVGDIELFARSVKQTKAKVIGITGSNGKSTVTTMVGEMLKESGIRYAVAGNIGIPALTQLKSDIDVYVLELSSFQLDTTQSLDCHIAVILNITQDHQDRYTTFEDYTNSKLALYRQSQIQLVDCHAPAAQNLLASKPLMFGRSAEKNLAWRLEEGQIFKKNQIICATDQVRLEGKHNHFNTMVAMALADQVGASLPALLSVAHRFSGLRHRFEWVDERRGVRYINDSKATNIGATIAAIESLDYIKGRLILIAGGDAKDADLSPLSNALNQIDMLITLGQDGSKIAALKPHSQYVSTMDEAVILAAKYANKGDLVLLSPACASWDMYPNFQTRGDDFCQCVKRLSLC